MALIQSETIDGIRILRLDHGKPNSISTDMARTLSNIADNFKPGEVYNIGGLDFHTIEEAADIILRLTGK